VRRRDVRTAGSVKGSPSSKMAEHAIAAAACEPPPGVSIAEELGTGTFGTVYRATIDGTVVAAKRFLTGAADDCGAEKSGQREAKMLRRTGPHPLVCGLVAETATADALWLLTDLGGPSLASLTWLKIEGEYTRTCGVSSRTYRVDRGDLWHELFADDVVPYKKLRVLLSRLLEAVEHLAARGIVHADIKPDNILINVATATPRLCDFGSAYEFSVGDPGGSATPEYRAPECVLAPQTLRNAPPASVDVYAVGAVFLELACGFPLWFPFNSVQKPKFYGSLVRWCSTDHASVEKVNPASLVDFYAGSTAELRIRRVGRRTAASRATGSAGPSRCRIERARRSRKNNGKLLWTSALC